MYEMADDLQYAALAVDSADISSADSIDLRNPAAGRTSTRTASGAA